MRRELSLSPQCSTELGCFPIHSFVPHSSPSASRIPGPVRGCAGDPRGVQVRGRDCDYSCGPLRAGNPTGQWWVGVPDPGRRQEGLPGGKDIGTGPWDELVLVIS